MRVCERRDLGSLLIVISVMFDPISSIPLGRFYYDLGMNVRSITTIHSQMCNEDV